MSILGGADESTCLPRSLIIMWLCLVGSSSPACFRYPRCPAYSIIEGGLAATRQALCVLFRGELEFIGEEVCCLPKGVLPSLVGELEHGEHQGLEIGNRHTYLRTLICSA